MFMFMYSMCSMGCTRTRTLLVAWGTKPWSNRSSSAIVGFEATQYNDICSLLGVAYVHTVQSGCIGDCHVLQVYIGWHANKCVFEVTPIGTTTFSLNAQPW